MYGFKTNNETKEMEMIMEMMNVHPSIIDKKTFDEVFTREYARFEYFSLLAKVMNCTNTAEDEKKQRMKKETRNVVVLDWEDKIKLQQSIRDLEEVAETYQRPCKELTGINNTLYYLKTIEEEINQRMSLKKK